MNGAVKDGMDSVQNLVDTNSSILEKLEEISADLPDALKEAVSGRIAELQAQNEEFQTLLDSLSQSNASMGNAMDTAQSTKEQLETLVSQSRQSLRDYRNNFDQTLLPQLNESMDTFSALGGEMSAALSGVSDVYKRQDIECFLLYKWKPMWVCPLCFIIGKFQSNRKKVRI